MVGPGYGTSDPTSSDILPPSTLHLERLHKLPKQHRHLATKYSNKGAHGELCIQTTVRLAHVPIIVHRSLDGALSAQQLCVLFSYRILLCFEVTIAKGKGCAVTPLLVIRV